MNMYLTDVYRPETRLYNLPIENDTIFFLRWVYTPGVTDLRCRFQHRYPIAATTHVITDHRLDLIGVNLFSQSKSPLELSQFSSLWRLARM